MTHAVALIAIGCAPFVNVAPPTVGRSRAYMASINASALADVYAATPIVRSVWVDASGRVQISRPELARPEGGGCGCVVVIALPPKQIVDLPPEYPAHARSARTEASVVLEIVVAIDGAVERVRVLEHAAPFERAAIAAVRRWRFSPTFVDEHLARVLMRVTINFRVAT